ncbi:AraC family transcriptional regulator [Kitasatospora cathayae]|uniref:AraC family transcriptional regulator n=1 Tax=Kitasatospora cathayae TaxID=3004092 RepID=A0ABY7QET3_9ACTN|nr:AraC family transcriptional regulator [Kitasatospora sp. HUAS 3-15]WBP91225.1 AraC family transcriptional regulator [Kitasatospora sp. HUAS 3-15]
MTVSGPGADEGGSGPITLYEGRCVEQLHQAVGERFAPHRMTVTGGQRINGRFRLIHEGSIALYEIGYGADVSVDPGELPDFHNIQLPVAGGGKVLVDGRVLPSSPFIVGPGERLSMEWDAEALNRVLIIPARTVEHALAVRLGDSPPGLARFSHVLDDRNPAVKSWTELAWSFNAFAASPLSRCSPLAVQHFENLLVDGLLDAQPHSWSNAVAERGARLLPGALRRATDYCAEHAHEAISVADIAQAARVSLRTLREGFRTHLQTTPLAYLKARRLDHAHRDLIAISDGRSTGTVSEVACRWGFTHLGRFSADYRRAYQQSPSETLRCGGRGDQRR